MASQRIIPLTLEPSHLGGRCGPMLEQKTFMQQTEEMMWATLADALREEIQEYSWLLHLIHREEPYGSGVADEAIGGMTLSIAEQVGIAFRSRQIRIGREQALVNYKGIHATNSAEVLYYEVPKSISGLFAALLEEVKALVSQLKRVQATPVLHVDDDLERLSTICADWPWLSKGQSTTVDDGFMQILLMNRVLS